MIFRAEQYYQVSLERMKQARNLYEVGDSFALAMYSSGLAVECLLRAFRWIEDSSFEGRHDLSALFDASRFLDHNDNLNQRNGETEAASELSQLRLQTAMQEVVVLWHNNLRFSSEASTRAFLKRSRLAQGIKGDPLKKNAGQLLAASQTILDRGVILWNFARRSKRR